MFVMEQVSGELVGWESRRTEVLAVTGRGLWRLKPPVGGAGSEVRERPEMRSLPNF